MWGDEALSITCVVVSLSRSLGTGEAPVLKVMDILPYVRRVIAHSSPLARDHVRALISLGVSVCGCLAGLGPMVNHATIIFKLASCPPVCFYFLSAHHHHIIIMHHPTQRGYAHSLILFCILFVLLTTFIDMIKTTQLFSHSSTHVNSVDFSCFPFHDTAHLS